MGFLEIGLSQGNIIPDHVQGFVPENPLEGKYIAAVAEIRDSEGVSKGMRRCPYSLYPSLVCIRFYY